MQHLEVSSAVRHIYMTLGGKWLNFSLVNSLFSPHTILQSRFFLICRPWKFAALGPGPLARA
jgi:hypothetical protein